MNYWLNKTHLGDCRALLLEMADSGVRVQTCVTSPPYFGLRDYQTGTWDGGDPACTHKKAANADASIARSTLGGGKKTTGHTQEGFRVSCARCGAMRIDRQIGLEVSPTAYVEQMVAVFRAVRNVLVDDGTLWLNLGDSYATQPGKGSNVPQTKWKANAYPESAAHRSFDVGVAPKNLLGIPWRVALALQADGWYLRSDIIWHKPNAMPESVTDRPTKAHEYVFLLSKSERYYYDAEAIQERAKYPGDHRFLRGPVEGCESDTVAWRAKSQQTRKLAGIDSRTAGDEWRNRRSVWSIASESFSGAHFATFPRALIEPCIVAGSAPGGVVLDPFMGSGTTAQVATDLGRNFIGCELNPEYIQLHEMRRTTIGMPI